jgi:uncharacterized membrane protein
MEVKMAVVSDAGEAPDRSPPAARISCATPGAKTRLWTVLYCVLISCMMSLMVGATLSYSSPALLQLTRLEDPQFRFNVRLSSIFGVSVRQPCPFLLF